MTANIDIQKFQELQVPYGRNAILGAYEKAGYDRSETVQEKSFYGWFLPLATGKQEDVPRPVTKQVTAIYRIKRKSKEYLFYIASFKAQDWKRNPIDFGGMIFGRYELPRFHRLSTQTTNEDGTIQQMTQILGHETIYDIEFSKQRVKELVDMAAEAGDGPLGLIVIDQTGRNYSCSLSEFMNESYDELVDKKSGYAEYLKSKDRRNSS